MIHKYTIAAVMMSGSLVLLAILQNGNYFFLYDAARNNESRYGQGVVIDKSYLDVAGRREYVPTDVVVETIASESVTYRREDFKGPLKVGAEYHVHSDTERSDGLLGGLVDDSYARLVDRAGNKTNYAKDKNFVFFICVQEPCAYTIKNADPLTFEVLLQTSFVYDPLDDFGFRHVRVARDRNHVFYGDVVVEGVDAATFSVLKDPQGRFSSFAKDKSNIYSLINTAHQLAASGYVIEGADYDTFEVLGSMDARDKDRSYNFFPRAQE